MVEDVSESAPRGELHVADPSRCGAHRVAILDWIAARPQKGTSSQCPFLAALVGARKTRLDIDIGAGEGQET